MNVHQGRDGDWSLQPELSCLGDEALAATQEKEGSSLVSSGLHSLTYPLAARSEGTGGHSHPDIVYPGGMQTLPEHIFS